MSKSDFWQTGRHQKVCRWIRHNLGTGILVDCHKDNMIPQFQLMTTSETLKIANGIAFENWSNGFVISSNLEHRKSLTPKIWCKRNFFIWVNWSRVIVCQTRLPEILNNMQICNKGNWPTLRGSKPSQTDLKWLETWHTSSLICILNIPQVEIHETLPIAIYSIKN